MDKLVGAFSGVLKTSNAPTSQPAAAQGDRQYLRLPLESARKLRWFEKADLQALTKSHLREKRELLDTLTVLKKLLVRHGLDEAKLDVEVAAHLRTAQELAEEHEGVASVLLAALEPQVQQLRFENERLQAAIRMGQHAALTKCPPSRVNGQVPEAADGGEMAESLSVGGTSLPHVLTSTALMPRRLEHLDLAQVRCSASARMDPLVQQQLATLETQCAEYAKEVSELKAILAKQQQQQQQQQAAAGRRRAPEANAPMQDMLLSLQEVAREEARKAALADARAMRLEGELKALQGQHKAVVKENTVLQQQVTQLREEVAAAEAAAEARVAEAAAAGEGARAAAEAREEAAALRQINTTLRAELSSAQGCISRLEADMQLAQQRVATSTAALAEAEAVARRSDGLAAANMQLMQRLAESKTELEMATYYKKVCSELMEAKSQFEEQLLSLGSLLSASELKLADMAARATAAEEHAAVAECRARAAESSIAAEVERRCGTALSSRALWPPALRDNVECLEARLGKAEAALPAAEQRAEVAIRTETELREQLHVKEEELAVLTRESAAATTSFAAQLQQLREALAESQARTAGLQDDLMQSRAREEAAAAAAAAAEAAGPSHVTQRRHSSGGNTNGVGASSFLTSTAVMTPKWQIQNKVGGGGLYNLDAKMGDGAGSGNGSSGGSGSSRLPTAGSTGIGAATSNVDAVYMKNVLFKFLEAHLTNKVQERDILLPAVATLLQATQEEYIALQKILRATMPPSRQMLSVFGLSR